MNGTTARRSGRCPARAEQLRTSSTGRRAKSQRERWSPILEANRCEGVKRLPIPKSADLDEEVAYPQVRMSWSGRSDDCSLVVARFLAKTYDREGRHYAMFVRFRETPYGLQVSLIQTRREGGKARHEHIAGLGAITIPTSAADRIAFWRRLHDRLSALSNRIVDEQSKILGAVDERIPMPTPDELRDVQLENAKGRGCVACTPIRLKVTKAPSVPPSGLSPIAKQAPGTPPSTPRRQRNGLSGETSEERPQQVADAQRS
jgi:hypothetical protein